MSFCVFHYFAFNLKWTDKRQCERESVEKHWPRVNDS